MKPTSRAAGVTAAAAFATVLSACVVRQGLPDAGLAVGPRIADARFDVQVAATASGLRYALVPDPRSDVVTVDVRYTVGAADDPTGKSGLAHLVEHLTYSHAASDGPSLAHRLDQLALSYNAYTNWDETHYTATALGTNLAGLLAVEAERMAPSCDRVTAEVFERERSVVVNEGRQRPSDDVWQQVRGRLFGADHPYGRPIGGSDIAAITAADVCAFLTAHYAPSRAILVVVGPFDPATVRILIDQQFGAIQRTAGSQRTLAAITTAGESVLTADVDEPTAVIAFPAPPWGKKGNASRELVLDLWVRNAQGQGDELGITSVRRGSLGGYRGGVDLVTVTADHWSKLPAAVDAVFKARDGILADDFTLARRDVRSSHVNNHLGSLEQFSGMGIRVADFLQYADHPWFMIAGFNEAEALWAEGLVVKIRTIDGYYAPRLVDYAEDSPQLVAAIAGLPTRAGVHVAWIKPDKAAPTMDAVPAVTPRVDVAEWKSPIEPGDADKPLPVPVAPTRPAPQRMTLPNGLHVVLAPIEGSPVVDIRLVFNAGTFNDPASHPGLAAMAANMIEHKLPETPTQDELTRAYWALGLGTHMTADVDEDTTAFRATGAARYFDWHMWSLFWMLDQGAYYGSTIDRFRKRIKPAERPALATVLATALVGPAAVRDPDPRLLARIGVDELESFRDTHYLPKGATLIVSGGFGMATLAAIIPRLWGTWRGSPPRVRYPRVTAAPTGQRHLAIDDDEARQLTVALAFPVSSTDLAARVVIEEMVDSHMRSVRDRLGITYGVDAEYRVLLDAAPALLVTGEVDPARGGEAIKAMLTALRELRADRAAFTRAFVLARRRVVGRLLGRVTDTHALAGELETLARSGWSRQDVDQLIASVAALTPATVTASMGKDMVESAAVIALSGRRDAIERAYRDAGLPMPNFAGARPTAVSARP